MDLNTNKALDAALDDFCPDLTARQRTFVYSHCRPTDTPMRFAVTLPLRRVTPATTTVRLALYDRQPWGLEGQTEASQHTVSTYVFEFRGSSA